MGETAIVVEDRKELTYLLSQAAELEHGLMCEYLYAAFNLERRKEWKAPTPRASSSRDPRSRR